MQLVAYGAQDVYLTGNPQITYFKVVYRRHTNFAIESIEQTFNGTCDFGKKVSCTISRNGDLIHKVFFQVSLPALTAANGDVAWMHRLGHNLVNNVNLEIGGQEIDKHYSDWLEIWSQLTVPAGQQLGYSEMIGDTPDLTAPGLTSTPAKTLYIPLQFWFNRNPGLALPLIALQYHEVKINIELSSFASMITTTPPSGASSVTVTGGSIPYASLWVDYVYLDTDERRRFAQVSHEYLVEQLQFTGAESVSSTQNKVRLNFNHPCKELIWVVNSTGNAQWNDYETPTTPSSNPVLFGKLQLNGHDRFYQREGTYFNLVQPYSVHTNIPQSKGINVYSFGLKPEDHQPSGTCNMSRIDNATLNLTLDSSIFAGGASAQVKIFATNYNVLRIMSGMGGLAYSN